MCTKVLQLYVYMDMLPVCEVMHYTITITSNMRRSSTLLVLLWF